MASKIKLGDTVRGVYHGTKFAGVVESYDGSCYLYIRLEAPITVYGECRDELAIHPDSDERDSLAVISRPETAPAVRHLSNAALGIVRLA